jgi:hypothetical protein
MSSVLPAALLPLTLPQAKPERELGSPASGTADAKQDMHHMRVELLSQRLAIHLSQEVWQRLFHGTGQDGITFTQVSLAVLFIESPLHEASPCSQDIFFAAMERLAREHSGTVDLFAWGGSLLFFPGPVQAVRTALALQRVASDRSLRMGVHHGECLLARFRSAGVSHATLLGAESTQASALASATDYGSIGLSPQVLRDWLDLAAHDADAANGWRSERNGNGSMRLVPTNRSQPAA